MHAPAVTELLFHLGVRLMGRRELLLQLRRRRLVVTELEAVRAMAGGDRFPPRREVLELWERRLRGNLHDAGARRIRPLDLAGMTGELAGDGAHLLLRRG